MERLMSFVGLFVLVLIAWLLSNDRKSFDWKLVAGGLAIQFLLALLLLKTVIGHTIFAAANNGINAILLLSDQGAQFIFGDNFTDHFFAFKVLPTIIFVSALSYLLFYFGIIQKIIEALAWLMSKFMGITGVEAMVAAANVFVGQTEAPLLIKPYLKSMTKTEITVMMTSGMATVAGGVMAAYVSLGASAGHLLAASIMSAPASIIIARILHPEKESPVTQGTVSLQLKSDDTNAFDAACKGAAEGLKLALNVGAVLIAFIAIVAFINMILGAVLGIFGISITFEQILGTLFQPIAFLLGVPWAESAIVGELLGIKMVVNEYLGYIKLSELIKSDALSERSITIATYALCGFANFSSIGIQIGGIGALEPSRREDFSKMAFKAMIGGTIAAFMTATIAGIFI